MSHSIPPSNYKLEFSREALDERITALGQELTAWSKQVWADSHTDVLVLPILRGALFFAADLVRAIQHSIEFVPIRALTYEANAVLSAGSEVDMSIDQVPARGRVVLLLDDICDSGKTLDSLSRALLARGSREVKSAVAVHRLLHDQLHKPDWVALQYAGPEWLVGYGMDDSGRYRNLPGVYSIRRDAGDE